MFMKQNFQKEIPPMPHIPTISDYISELITIRKHIERMYLAKRISKDEALFASTCFKESGDMLKRYAERDEEVGQTERKQGQT